MQYALILMVSLLLIIIEVNITQLSQLTVGKRFISAKLRELLDSLESILPALNYGWVSQLCPRRKYVVSDFSIEWHVE